MFDDLRLLALMLPLLVPLSAPADTPSAGPLTISAAEQEARAHSPELKGLEAKLEGAGYRRLEALSPYLPHVSLDATHFLAAKYARLGILFGGNNVNIPSAFPQDMLDLNASITLFDGLSGWYAYRASKLGYSATEHEVSRARFEIEREVRMRFYQAIAAETLREVASSNIKSLEDHLGIARATERSGMGTRYNVLRLEAQLEEAQAEKMLADDNSAIARRNLAEVMGLEISDARPLQGTLPEPTLSDSVTKLSLDASARDDIKAQQLREEAVDQQSSSANGFWYPKLSLFAQQQFYKYGSFDPVVLNNDSFQSAYGVGLKLQWDLFDGGQSYARREIAAAEAKQAAERTHAALVKAPADFEQWRRRYLYNAALYRARLRTLAKSQESVRLATLGLRAGTNTNSEVLDAELDLFRARAGVVRAQLEASEALLKLELAVGHEIAAR